MTALVEQALPLNAILAEVKSQAPCITKKLRYKKCLQKLRGLIYVKKPRKQLQRRMGCVGAMCARYWLLDCSRQFAELKVAKMMATALHRNILDMFGVHNGDWGGGRKFNQPPLLLGG
jgi:hypothetical protein